MNHNNCLIFGYFLIDLMLAFDYCSHEPRHVLCSSNEMLSYCCEPSIFTVVQSKDFTAEETQTIENQLVIIEQNQPSIL